MTDALRAAIREMLASVTTMSLSTCRDGRPWAATVFFASDPEFGLYFVSDSRTRHAEDIAAGSAVAATITPECTHWHDVRGLQLEGRAEVLDGIARLAGLKCFLGRFPDVRALFERPQGDDEQTIAERLRSANLYCLRPSRIRLIDNSRGFGFREELWLQKRPNCQ